MLQVLYCKYICFVQQIQEMQRLLHHPDVNTHHPGQATEPAGEAGKHLQRVADSHGQCAVTDTAHFTCTPVHCNAGSFIVLGAVYLYLCSVAGVVGAVYFSSVADVLGAVYFSSVADVLGAVYFSYVADVLGAVYFSSVADVLGAVYFSSVADVLGAVYFSSVAVQVIYLTLLFKIMEALHFLYVTTVHCNEERLV